MKKGYVLLILCAFILIAGLAFWQIQHLTKTQKLQAEIEEQNITSSLKTVAISLRKMEIADSTVRINDQRATAVIDSLINKTFKSKISWGVFYGNKILTNNDSKKDVEELKSSQFGVCLSCLVMINVLDDEGNTPSNFFLDQSPAQMIQMKGNVFKTLKYLYILVEPAQIDFKVYTFPVLFFISLISLFFWLFYLYRKQNLLVAQKNEFVNHLSHQFQTPLSSIKLSANLLAKKYKNDELIQIIQTEGNRLENHIKTVLHWVKSDADRLQVLTERIGVTDVIEMALKQMKPVFLSHKTTIKFSPPEEELFIEADKNHLQLVLFNIWENAIKHNETPIELTISCTRRKRMISICNQDNGKGIQKPKNELKYKGLGLQYIDKIMTIHKGDLQLLNNENQGLNVILNFPSYE